MAIVSVSITGSCPVCKKLNVKAVKHSRKPEDKTQTDGYDQTHPVLPDPHADDAEINCYAGVLDSLGILTDFHAPEAR